MELLSLFKTKNHAKRPACRSALAFAGKKQARRAHRTRAHAAAGSIACARLDRRPARAPRRRAQLGEHWRERPRGAPPPARGAARAPRRGLARRAGRLGRVPRRALAGARVRALGVARRDFASSRYICRSPGTQGALKACCVMCARVLSMHMCCRRKRL